MAVAGAAINWLRDNINLVTDVSEVENLADRVMHTGDVYFVPAFSGLYAPYWQQDARGLVIENYTLFFFLLLLFTLMLFHYFACYPLYY